MILIELSEDPVTRKRSSLDTASDRTASRVVLEDTMRQIKLPEWRLVKWCTSFCVCFSNILTDLSADAEKNHLPEAARPIAVTLSTQN